MASLAIVTIFVQTGAAETRLQAGEAAARRLQTLGDELLIEVHKQHDHLADYLLSPNPTSLAGYQRAVADETAIDAQIQADADKVAGTTAALTAVAHANDVWRDTVADPAIAAVKTGSAEALAAAIQNEVQDQAATHTAASNFILMIDGAEAALEVRAVALNRFRVAAMVAGVAIELLAAGLSLWFVRRYGSTVSRDARRRARTSAERIQIVASLRTLQTQPTPEATARIIAVALNRLPGVDFAGVFESSQDGLVALSMVGLPGFPLRTGDAVPVEHARYLLGRSHTGHGLSVGRDHPNRTHTKPPSLRSASKAAPLRRSRSTARLSVWSVSPRRTRITAVTSSRMCRPSANSRRSPRRSWRPRCLRAAIRPSGASGSTPSSCRPRSGRSSSQSPTWAPEQSSDSRP